ncbi:MAG TPA: SurA N-terminal domain-containing protein [Terriglobales bacterium]|jgi:hypothetical protein
MKSAAITASLVLFVGACLGQGGEVLDRMVATVNGHVMLASDWEDELHYEAMIGGRPVASLTEQDRKAALERMIDQELLREQMRTSDQQAPPAEEAAAQVAALRKQISGAETEAGWNAVLEQYGMTQQEVEKRIASQIALTHLIDDRLRPTIQVDEQSIEEYYNQTFLPRLRQSGGKEVSLAEASPQIRSVLAEQQLDQAVADWVQGLRANSEIKMQPGSAAR